MLNSIKSFRILLDAQFETVSRLGMKKHSELDKVAVYNVLFYAEMAW